jgi:pyrroloquinoline-quinone synthase
MGDVMASTTSSALSGLTSRWPLLKHSFYQRWTDGSLTTDELRYYSDQYRHLVVALPQWLNIAAAGHPTRGPELTAHAREEAAHVALWDRFREGIGVEGAGDPPNAATSTVLGIGRALADQGLGTAAAWALEAQAPEVSRAKADGLARHYGIDGGSGAAYFELHSTMDVAHTRELEAAIDELPADLQDRAVKAANSILAGLWDILSSSESVAAS